MMTDSPLDRDSDLPLDQRITASLVAEDEDFGTMITNSSVDGILAYDREFRYTLWNPALERLTGLRKDQVIGRYAFELFPFLRQVGHDRLFYMAIAGKELASDEVPYHFPYSGKSGFLVSIHQPLRNEAGEIVGGLGIVREVTDKVKATEELRQLNSTLEKQVFARTAELESAVRTLQSQIEETRRADAALRFIISSGEVLNETMPDFQKTLDAIVRLCTQQFDGWCTIRVEDPQGATIRVTGHQDPTLRAQAEENEASYPPLPTDVSGPTHIARSLKTEWYPYIRQDELMAYARDERHLQLMQAMNLKSYIGVPLAQKGRLYGTLSIFTNRRYYTLDELKLAEELGRHFSMAIAVARLLHEANTVRTSEKT